MSYNNSKPKPDDIPPPPKSRICNVQSCRKKFKPTSRWLFSCPKCNKFKKVSSLHCSGQYEDGVWY